MYSFLSAFIPKDEEKNIFVSSSSSSLSSSWVERQENNFVLLLLLHLWMKTLRKILVFHQLSKETLVLAA